MRNILVLFIVLVGCSIAKKNQQSVDRVLGSRELMDKVAPEINRIYPCNSDTIFKLVSDTVTKVENDTTYTFYHYSDTVVKNNIITKVKTIKITDTIKQIVESHQKEDILNAKIANNQKVHEQDLATVISQSAIINTEQTKNKEYLSVMILLAALILGSAIFKIYKTIKPI